MTAPTPPDNGEILSEPATLQVVNLLARLNNTLAEDGPLFKRLDHADEMAHGMAQQLERRTDLIHGLINENALAQSGLQRMIADVHADVEKITDVLAKYGPLLEQAQALVNPGAVARAYVTGSRRRAGHRRQD